MQYQQISMNAQLRGTTPGDLLDMYTSDELTAIGEEMGVVVRGDKAKKIDQLKQAFEVAMDCDRFWAVYGAEQEAQG